MNIILIGFKASGKSTVGAVLAQLLKRPFIDTDRRIEDLYHVYAEQNLDKRAIYNSLDADAFRSLEKAAIASLLWEKKSVIATGGGVVLTSENVRVLKKIGVCIFLDAPLEVLQKRVKDDPSPIFQDTDLATLYETRVPLYRKMADIS